MDPRSILDNMLRAVEENDYDAFAAEADERFMASITDTMFQGMSLQVAARLKRGFAVTLVDELNQQGCQVFLWKLRFTDGGSDTLAQLALKDEKVVGFWLK